MDKIHNKINNLKSLLDCKYKERDKSLKEENIEYFDVIDKEIFSMEIEIKNLEKDLEKISIDNNCKNKRHCINKSKCYDETCLFIHSNNWNPYNNKVECLNCKKGFCNKINKKYKHNYNNLKFKVIVNKLILINKIVKFLEKNKCKNQKMEEITNELKNIETDIKITIDTSDRVNLKQDIKRIICLMEKDIELYFEKIINNLDNMNLDIDVKINMKIQLNNIKSKIQLLRYNSEDLI